MLYVEGLWAGMRRGRAPFALIGTAFLVTACAGSGDLTTASLAPPPETATTLGQNTVGSPSSRSVSTSALADISKTSENGSASSVGDAQSSAKSADAAIKKAKQLRLAGKKVAALKVLDNSENSETSPTLVKQRGMLALELGQLAKAEKLLTRARDDFEPDWRVHSALGATLSARGNQQAAQIEFSNALKLAPDHPSVLNNLALSYALDGNHDQAETLLRQASVQQKSKLKTKQNLALLLGLNGNVKEAHKVSKLVLPAKKAEANVAYFASRKMKTAQVSKADTTSPAQPIQSASVASSGR